MSVRYATSDGTARAGVHYPATSGVVTFAAGKTARTIWILLLAGTTRQEWATLGLTLGDPTGGATLGILSRTLAVILGD